MMHNTSFLSILSLILLSYCAQAQTTQPPFTPVGERMQGFEKRKALKNNSLVSAVPFRNVGPSIQSGRVVDIAVRPDDPSHFYVAYASGGLWKTENNGVSFEPLFDDAAVMTLGAVNVDWERNIIWLGTGEVNSSRSSYAGNGVYKSMDGGKNWQHMGLGESHHIGRILLDADNPDVALVAALGHLYSPNQERGVYRTTDGGKNWTKVLFVDGDTGAVEMVRDPSNTDTYYAATWTRERRAWDFVESGAGSAVWKSTDGGASWSKSSKGLPQGKGAGRIGLAAAAQNGNTVLYASIDNYDRRPKEKEEDEDAITKDMLRGMPVADFLRLEDYLLEDFLRSSGFPDKYKAKEIKQRVEKGEIGPIALVEYLEDANSMLFDTPVYGAQVYRSDNGGQSWQKTHENDLDGVYNSYGYYFGRIEVAADNPDRVYVLGVPIIRSDDGGKNWVSAHGDNVHADHHAIWINPNRPGHVILGNDGGINISYDHGNSWVKCNTPAVGQFYAVAVDNAKPYNIYGGLQDNGVLMGPSTYEASTSWQQRGKYPFEFIMGGDGMQVAVDTRDNHTVYTGFQFGNYFRINTKTGQRAYITPRHELGERPLRWNWQTPIHLSVHNPDIFYMGSNKLHRSFNQGDDFKTISEDLTKGGRKGDVPYGTLSSIHESPLRFGLLYTGSDDGLIHVSRDGGYSWQNISQGLPEDMWVTKVQASAAEEGRVYASLNGYRWDDFRSMVYVSEDYGKTWKKIGQDLPAEPVNVIEEDPHNPEILYVGTDHGLYVSLNRGKSFMVLGNMPGVAVHDVVVQEREKELLVGTHGRSLYIGSVKELQQLSDDQRKDDLVVFDVASMRYSGRWGRQSFFSNEDSAPELLIPVYSKTGGKASIRILGEDDMELRAFAQNLQKGLNYVSYNMSIQADQKDDYEKMLTKDRKKEEKEIKVKAADNGDIYLREGTYTIQVSMGGAESEVELEVK